MLRAHGDIAGESDVRALATDGGGIDDLSSDFMLVRAVMLAAGRILGSERVVAVAPKRGWLLVRSGRPGDLRAALPLLQAADGVAGRAGEHALSRMAFHFTQGESVGVTVRHGNSGYVSLIRSKEDEWLGGAA